MQGGKLELGFHFSGVLEVTWKRSSEEGTLELLWGNLKDEGVKTSGEAASPTDSSSGF